MEKTKVLAALDRCNNAHTCNGCPYNGIEDCDKKLHDDAVVLINAKQATKYTQAIIFTKRTSMSEYCTGKVTQRVTSTEAFNRMCEYYAKEREVQLIALFRWEGRKCFCKIKCPINPLPVKGEFETPSEGVVGSFLHENGWKFKQKFYPSMFE